MRLRDQNRTLKLSDSLLSSNFNKLSNVQTNSGRSDSDQQQRFNFMETSDKLMMYQLNQNDPLFLGSNHHPINN